MLQLQEEKPQMKGSGRSSAQAHPGRHPAHGWKVCFSHWHVEWPPKVSVIHTFCQFLNSAKHP